MPDLQTKFSGITLRNPVIVGSSGLTKNVDNLKEFEKYNAGAVILKSLFEEQIQYEIQNVHQKDPAYNSYPEAQDYIANYSRQHKLEEYLKLIRDAKSTLSIPVFASINCHTAGEWVSFAKEIENAGADALELNLFIMPSDPDKTGEENEKIYFEILSSVKNVIKIPVILKVSSFFSSFAHTARKLSWAGVDGMVFFNRFFSPDINIENFTITAANIYSSPQEMSVPLRWIALMANRMHCDLAASTGVHDAQAAIKMLLAGAKAVQICSTLYKNGFEQIKSITDGIEQWMNKMAFNKVDDFIGKMSYEETKNPAAYERVQFMKHLAGIE